MKNIDLITKEAIREEFTRYARRRNFKNEINDEDIVYFCRQKCGHLMSYYFLDKEGKVILVVPESYKDNFTKSLEIFTEVKDSISAMIFGKKTQQIGNSGFYIILEREEYTPEELENFARGLRQ